MPPAVIVRAGDWRQMIGGDESQDHSPRSRSRLRKPTRCAVGDLDRRDSARRIARRRHASSRDLPGSSVCEPAARAEPRRPPIRTHHVSSIAIRHLGARRFKDHNDASLGRELDAAEQHRAFARALRVAPQPLRRAVEAAMVGDVRYVESGGAMPRAILLHRERVLRVVRVSSCGCERRTRRRQGHPCAGPPSAAAGRRRGARAGHRPRTRAEPTQNSHHAIRAATTANVATRQHCEVPRMSDDRRAR